MTHLHAFVGLVVMDLGFVEGQGLVSADSPGWLVPDARQGKFDVVLVWASDRLARSVRHFLDVLDEFNHLNIEFVSFREQLDTAGPLGRAIVVIIGAIAELERALIIERVRAGMRRAQLEGRRLGRTPLAIDRQGLLRARARGMSLSELAKTYRVSRSSVCRALREAVPKGVLQPSSQAHENRPPETAA
jgi:DNA invertase Pin-like site-specific DNA recombinase